MWQVFTLKDPISSMHSVQDFLFRGCPSVASFNTSNLKVFETAVGRMRKQSSAGLTEKFD